MTTFIDLVGGTSTTTGTGAYSISGTINGMGPFSDVADGTELTVYVSMGADYELVTGLLGSTGTTLTRVSVHKSSNSDAAVDWGSGTKTLRVVASSEMLTALGDVVTDTTPTLGGDLDANGKAITGLKEIALVGDTGTLTAEPNPFINVNTSRAYDYDVTIAGIYTGLALPEVVYFGGTHTLERDANPLAIGSLFNVECTLTNNTTEARTYQPFYSLNAGPTFLADTTACTLGAHIDVFSQPKFNTQNGGTLAATRAVGFQNFINVGAGATVTRAIGFLAQEGTVTGTLTSRIGFATKGSAAANDVGLAIGYAGTDSAPSGDWGIYQGNGDARPTHWNGAQEYKINTSSATTITLDASHHTMKCTSASAVTVNLPTAVGVSGREYFIKRTGAGAVTVDGDGAQTIDGAATYALATQYDGVRVQSDGANWIITGIV